MQACYGDELRVEPTLFGRVEVEFAVGADGAVSARLADAASALDRYRILNPYVSNCVVEVARTIRLVPAPRAR